jgi:hypothetical protein
MARTPAAPVTPEQEAAAIRLAERMHTASKDDFLHLQGLRRPPLAKGMPRAESKAFGRRTAGPWGQPVQPVGGHPLFLRPAHPPARRRHAGPAAAAGKASAPPWPGRTARARRRGPASISRW